MTDQRFHYPFSAYVTGILTYTQLVDALKNYLADYPQQLAQCAKQNLWLLRTKKISELQYHTLQTLFNTLLPAPTPNQAQAPSSAAFNPVPAPPLQGLSSEDSIISTRLTPSPTSAIDSNTYHQSTQITPSSIQSDVASNLNLRSTHQSDQKKPAGLKKAQTSKTPAIKSKTHAHYATAGILVFAAGCLSGYIGHAFHPEISQKIAQHTRHWREQSANLAPKAALNTQVKTVIESRPMPIQAQQTTQPEVTAQIPANNSDPSLIQVHLNFSSDHPSSSLANVNQMEDDLIETFNSPDDLAAVLYETNLIKPKNPPSTQKQNSEQQNLQAIQTLLPEFIEQPLTHLTTMQDLLKALNTPKHLNTPVVQQARHAMAQTYLQMARTARQQQDWQQAALFLQQSIAVRIDPVQTK